MKQGKFGIRLAFYGILSFVLALLNQPLLCGLLLAFVLVAEGDRWAARQVTQGFLLSLVVSFFSGISYVIGSAAAVPFRILFGWYDHYEFTNTVQSVFAGIVYVGALILSILAILHLSRDQEANVPLLSNLAYHIFGEQKPPRPVKQQPVWPQQPPMPIPQPPQGQPQPPMQGQPVPMPMQGYPMPPQPQPMQQPVVDMNQTMQIPPVPPTAPEEPQPPTQQL